MLVHEVVEKKEKTGSFRLEIELIHEIEGIGYLFKLTDKIGYNEKDMMERNK